VNGLELLDLDEHNADTTVFGVSILSLWFSKTNWHLGFKDPKSGINSKTGLKAKADTEARPTSLKL